MPRLSRAQEFARQQIADLACRDLLPQALSSRLVEAVHLAIPSDAQNLFGVDPSTLLFNRLLAVSRGTAPHALWFLRHIYLTEPVSSLTHPEMMRAGHAAFVLHDHPETSWGIPPHLLAAIPPAKHSRLYHERNGPAGGVLRVCFAANQRWLAALALVRFGAERPFQPTDLVFMRLVAPLIGRALARSFDREYATTLAAQAAPGAAVALSETPGVLLLAASGTVRFATPAAEAWLDILHQTEMTATSGQSALPTAVSSAVAALQAGGTDAQAHVRPRIVATTPAGTLRIEAAMGAEDENRDHIAVILTPERPLPPPAVPRSWPLTPREQEILTLVLRGLSNRDIAASLVVSEHTVESHLAHAYDKLDVRSRTQLLARFFEDTYARHIYHATTTQPPLRQPCAPTVTVVASE